MSGFGAYLPQRDIDISFIVNPKDIWVEGNIARIVDDHFVDTVRAVDLSTGSRMQSLDFTIPPRSFPGGVEVGGALTGIWGSGNTMYFVEEHAGGGGAPAWRSIFTYDLVAGTRGTTEFPLTAPSSTPGSSLNNENPGGMSGDGGVLFVADTRSNRVFSYSQFDGLHLGLPIDFAVSGRPWGVATPDAQAGQVWVAQRSRRRLQRYFSTVVEESDSSITVSYSAPSTTGNRIDLAQADANINAFGIHLTHDTAWVVHNPTGSGTGNKLFAFNLLDWNEFVGDPGTGRHIRIEDEFINGYRIIGEYNGRTRLR